MISSYAFEVVNPRDNSEDKLSFPRARGLHLHLVPDPIMGATIKPFLRGLEDGQTAPSFWRSERS